MHLSKFEYLRFEHLDPDPRAQLNGPIWIWICNPEYYDMERLIAIIICNTVFFVQLNDYLVTGTRQQYWEELFVKHIMEVRTDSTG